MPQDVRLWLVDEDSGLSELPQGKIDREERIEDWIEKDISIISDDLLVIGRQVDTGFGIIDLLCLSRDGDLVIIELKRDKTPRDVVAQVLDYASWVKDLDDDKVKEIANLRLASESSSLDNAFMDKFGEKLPDALNQNHNMYIVSSELDTSTERIVNYLNEIHGVGINVATFQYFEQNEKAYLARVFLIPPEKAERQTKVRGRSPRLTEQELHDIADSNGVGDLYARFTKELSSLFDGSGTTRSSIFFKGLQDGQDKTMFSLLPSKSSIKEGLSFQLYLKRLSRYLNIDENGVLQLLPEKRWEWKYTKDATPEYSGYEGFFENEEGTEHFLTGLRKRKLLGSTDSED